MSHPKQVKLFIPWAKAMVAGATVDKPNYGKRMRRSGKSGRRRTKSRGINKKRKVD